MNRIKIVGVLVFLLSFLLAFISMEIANKNRTNISTLSSLTQQKSSTQEVSKSIFYIYRNGVRGSKVLDNIKLEKVCVNQNGKITALWNKFYRDVQKFINQQKIATGYNSIITDKLVNEIYHQSVILLNEFDMLIVSKKSHNQQEIEGYRKLQYMLFFILMGLLFYLFSQLHLVIEFIQKFSKTSSKIIKNSTIQGLEPIDIITSKHELKEATKNYNYMVEKMNLSITDSSNSMTVSIKSLEEVAQNIENFMELLSTMHKMKSDELFKKEDAVIDSLETLMCLRKSLKDLQIDLDTLSSLK